jgi:hypothetical protein
MKFAFGIAVFAVSCVTTCHLLAQNEGQVPSVNRRPTGQKSASISNKKKPEQVATIHWQRVPLRDVLGRLKGLFSEQVFVDRRVDPGLRVSLDIDASSAADVIAAIATDNGLSSARFGALVYLGPIGAADQLRSVGAARWQEVARLPAELRRSINSKQPTSWPRLAEPRELITSIVDKRGWRLANAEKIPHDLWTAGSLPEASLVEQLTVLLVGFDLTFAVRPNERAIELIPLDSTAPSLGLRPPGNTATTRTKPATPKKGQKQVYTLRVQQQPVRVVLQELMKRLHWAIQFDEEAIKAAAGSLDKRVSFSVENADREQLLEALLTPAGLDYQIEGEIIRIVPARYGSK